MPDQTATLKAATPQTAPTQPASGQPLTKPPRKKTTLFGWLCSIFIILIGIFIFFAATSPKNSSPPTLLVAAIAILFLVIIGWMTVTTIIDIFKAYKQNPRKVLIALGIAGLIILVILVVASYIFRPSAARADGGIFPYDRYAAETTQRALIYYTDGTENLVVTARFQGDSSDFAWVIPVPNKPEIFKSSSTLFNTLADITGSNQGGEPIYEKTSFGLGGAAKSQPVEVISEKTIDMYDTAVLKATDEQALAKWLVDHGYSFPAEKSSELKTYIDEGWYFAIAKIKPSAAASAEVQNRLLDGTITPLRLVFKTNRIIYPMKLTRIALDYVKKNPTLILDQPVSTSSSYLSNTIYIDLYVLTDGKTTQTTLDTKWANWIGKKEIDKLNSATGETWINPANKLFLTELSNTVSIAAINDDFTLTAAADNSVYPLPAYKTAAFWLANVFALLATPLVALLLPPGLLFIIFAILQRFVVKRKWIYTLLSIYQFLTSLGVIGILLITALAVGFGEGFSKALLEGGFGGFVVGMLIIAVVGFYFSVKMARRPKTAAVVYPNPAK